MGRTRIHSLFALLVLGLTVACSNEPPRTVEARVTGEDGSIEVQEEAEGYLVRDSSGPVFFYQLAKKSLDGEYERSNYVHPLYGLRGEVLTEDFPEDHRHQRGIFWTWHQIYVGDVRAGDPWLTTKFEWDVQESRALANGIEARIHWKSTDFGDGQEPILEETTTIRTHPIRHGVRFVDFDVSLRPLQEGVRIGGSEDDKGYGGFSARIKMLEDLVFTAQNGPVTPHRNELDLGDWVDFSADFAGDGSVSGVAILVHPSSIGYPQKWILRTAAGPSMQNPVWPGSEATMVPRGETALLKYRLVIHDGNAAKIDFSAIHAEYVAN